MNNLDFEKYENSLMPVIVQENGTNQILMQAYVNREALLMTMESKKATFISRKRGLWVKGLTSGDTLEVTQILTDCDNDSLIYKVNANGDGACHKDGWYSCFSREIDMNNKKIIDLLPSAE